MLEFNSQTPVLRWLSIRLNEQLRGTFPHLSQAARAWMSVVA